MYISHSHTSSSLCDICFAQVSKSNFLWCHQIVLITIHERVGSHMKLSQWSMVTDKYTTGTLKWHNTCYIRVIMCSQCDNFLSLSCLYIHEQAWLIVAVNHKMPIAFSEILLSILFVLFPPVTTIWQPSLPQSNYWQWMHPIKMALCVLAVKLDLSPLALLKDYHYSSCVMCYSMYCTPFFLLTCFLYFHCTGPFLA